MQYYIAAMSRVLVTSESVLTQLLFDYSLRVWIKAEGPEKNQAADATELQDGTAPKTKNATTSFIGRLTNLITIDLNNISMGRDLFFLCERLFVPSSLPQSYMGFSLGHAS